jgi:hypothetical protein
MFVLLRHIMRTSRRHVDQSHGLYFSSAQMQCLTSAEHSVGCLSTKHSKILHRDTRARVVRV